jgi:hypothetical protein
MRLFITHPWPGVIREAQMIENQQKKKKFETWDNEKRLLLCSFGGLRPEPGLLPLHPAATAGA